MKIKKHYILIFFLVFFSLVTNVYAARGELRYEVTNFSLNGTEITFEGWAFIHQTNNYNTIYKLNYNSSTRYANETKDVLLEDGGQQIKIIAINKSNESIIEEKTIDGNSDDKYYNFYKEMFYSYQKNDKNNASLVNCYNKGKNKGGCNNSCDNTYYSECYYKDLHFKITFDISSWNIEEDTPVYFKIAAYNNDYGKWTEGEKLYLGKNLISGTLSNNYIEVDKKTFSNKIYFIANSAQLLNQNLDIEKSGIYGNTGSYYLVEEINTGNGNFISGSISPGKYALYISQQGDCSYGPNKCWLSTCSNPNTCNDSSKVLVAHGSWVKPFGDTSFAIKVKNDKKCEVSKQSTDPMECNKWKDLSSECKELTVRNNNSSAVVKIEQNGYISNIFKSNLVNNDTNYNANSYDGGWFKYGITYYNEVSWNIGNLSQGNVEEIEYAMKSRLKSIQEFKDGLNLTITGLEEITGNKLIKNCSESGSFKNDNKNDNKLITVCTFFLPSSVLENFNGTVKYLEDENKANINNKYYIPLNEKEHSIKVTLENLSRLKDDKAKADSKDKTEPWTGTWTIGTECSLKVTNRLYENGKYKFIYRPIDLSNPFPNRSPGVNWYTWYIVERNKDKKTLEDSYKKIEYYTKLDNKTISEIKSYNKDNDYFGEVDSNFFKTYIKEGGQG